MAYKKKDITIDIPIIKQDPRYMVVETISGLINNKKIYATRGQTIRLNDGEYRVFKDKVLLIPDEG